MKFTSEPTPDQLLDLSNGSKMASLAPALTADLEKLMAQTANTVFTAISKQALTPDMAVQAWHQMAAYHRLSQRYNQQVKVGQSTAEALHKGE